MRGRAGHPAALAALCLALGVAGCAPPPPVRFASSEGGRAAPPLPYRQAHARWTRYGHLTNRFDTALDVYATFLSDEFRAAYVARVSEMRGLAGTERARLEAEQREASGQFIEFIVETVTSAWQWNDLVSERSVWTLTIADDRGRALGAHSVQPLTEKRITLETLFPPMVPFARAWRVRFPRVLPDGSPLLQPETKSLALRFAGPLGQQRLLWEADRTARGAR